MGLVIDVREGRPALVALSGDLDAFTSRRLRERLAEVLASGHDYIVIDIAGVDFIDSTALGVLVGALKRARQTGGEVRLQGATPAAKQVFDLTGLSNLFAIG